MTTQLDAIQRQLLSLDAKALDVAAAVERNTRWLRGAVILLIVLFLVLVYAALTVTP